MAGEKLVNLILKSKRSSSGGSNLLFGEVTSESPLKIKIDNRFEVDKDFLILSSMVKEMVINIPAIKPSYRDDKEHRHKIPATVTTSVDSGNQSVGHNHKIEEWFTEFEMPSIRLWRGLKKGDIVRLLRVTDSVYYVLEREEGVL